MSQGVIDDRPDLVTKFRLICDNSRSLQAPVSQPTLLLSQSGVIAHLSLVRGRLVDMGQQAGFLSLFPRTGSVGLSD